jgi:hypothetical protein
MVRTQIQLTEQQARRLRLIAQREGLSVAAVVRRCIDTALAEEAPTLQQRYARAAALAGQFEDPEGRTDLSTGHDRYLEEAYG